MRVTLDIEPQGIYTATQAIAATGMCKKTFYNYLKTGRIPSHLRLIDNKRVFKGFELIEALTNTMQMAPLGFGQVVKRRKKK